MLIDSSIIETPSCQSRELPELLYISFIIYTFDKNDSFMSLLPFPLLFLISSLKAVARYKLVICPSFTGKTGSEAGNARAEIVEMSICNGYDVSLMIPYVNAFIA